jgi:hypothetical protein
MTDEQHAASPIQPLTREVDSQLLAVYNALRNEILQRIQIQHQLFAVAVIALGAILTVGFQSNKVTPILSYPLLAMFLASAWAHNDRLIRLAGLYIKNYVEDETYVAERLGNSLIWWEHFYAPTHTGVLGTGDYFASRGIFIGGELTAILIGASQIKIGGMVSAFIAGAPVSKFATLENALFVVGVASIVVTFFMLRRPKDKQLLADAGTPHSANVSRKLA